MLRGVNNLVGIGLQAKCADNNLAGFYKALTLIRFTGRAQPSLAVFHPNDWQDFVLTTNASGDFMFGNPFQGVAPMSLFGIPVALSDAQTEGTGLVGDFSNFSLL